MPSHNLAEPAGVRLSFAYDEDVSAGVETLLVVLTRHARRIEAEQTVTPNPATDERPAADAAAA